MARKGLATEETLAVLEAGVESELASADAVAGEAPLPEPATAAAHVVAPPARLGLPDSRLPASPTLQQALLTNATSIAAATRRLVNA